MTMRPSLYSLLLWSALCACSASEGELSVELPDDVPAPPEDGIQLVGSPFRVAAGNEVIMCMEIDFEVTEDLYISESAVYQRDGGHHVLVYYTTGTAPVESAPHECNELDMGDIRLVGTGSAGGSGIALPEGKALKIPKGARLFFQSHYLNLTSEEIEVIDAVNLRMVPESQVEERVGSFAHVDLGLELPPGVETTRSFRCEMPYDMKPTHLIPHMHELGRHFEAYLEHGEERTQLFDVDWEEAFRDDFPEYKDIESLEFKKGDILETTCTWMNHEDLPARFPREMCVTFFLFYPSIDGALLSCDEKGNLNEL